MVILETYFDNMISVLITHLLLNMYLQIDKSFEPIVPTVAANVWIF